METLVLGADSVAAWLSHHYSVTTISLKDRTPFSYLDTYQDPPSQSLLDMWEVMDGPVIRLAPSPPSPAPDWVQSLQELLQLAETPLITHPSPFTLTHKPTIAADEVISITDHHIRLKVGGKTKTLQFKHLLVTDYFDTLGQLIPPPKPQPLISVSMSLEPSPSLAPCRVYLADPLGDPHIRAIRLDVNTTLTATHLKDSTHLVCQNLYRNVLVPAAAVLGATSTQPPLELIQGDELDNYILSHHQLTGDMCGLPCGPVQYGGIVNEQSGLYEHPSIHLLGPHVFPTPTDGSPLTTSLVWAETIMTSLGYSK